MFQFIYRVYANVRKQPRKNESGGGRGKQDSWGGGRGGDGKKTQRSSRKDLRLRNGTRKNESRGGRRSPSRKRSIQKLNSASSSKFRIQQRGVTAQERLDWQGERFSSSRKGNKKYRWGQRLTGRQMNYIFFFCAELPYSTPQRCFSRSHVGLSLNRPVKLTCFFPLSWQEDFLTLRREKICLSLGLISSSFFLKAWDELKNK